MGNDVSERSLAPSVGGNGTGRPGLRLISDPTSYPQPRTFSAAVKRVFDITVSTVAVIVLGPIFAACAIAIKLDSPGPVFYRARRVGRGGRDLDVLKFRKMQDGAGGAALTDDHDARFTRIGRFLARTKLDELPQLWTVLLGGMSIVGPRPEDRGFVELHQQEYTVVLNVKPGVTGLSQLAFAKEAEILDPGDRVGHYVDRILPQKVALDCLYAATGTFWLDVRIILWTLLPVVMRRDVAVNRLTGDMTIRSRERARVEAPAAPGDRQPNSSTSELV